MPIEPDSRQRLIDELAQAEAEFAAVNLQREAAKARVRAARSALEGQPAPVALSVAATSVHFAPITPDEKVRIYRSLFRGRADVYPTRFVSAKTGKPGWAPACANKFVRGVCELPKMKCGECPNQAFLPANDRAILDHLRGRHVMGVYPLLQDESCWFVAADFDKAAWREDVAAFRETCTSLGVPCAVERSRSGNGAHAWFFFTSPVPASIARKLGCFLITETMARRHELRMDSYDRLFPNQDTMPRGGFGNLIALPLQHEARKQGNTLFVDERFDPWPDQWSFLAALPRMSTDQVEAIAREAIQSGRVIGVRPADLGDHGDALPWTRPPSGRTAREQITGPLPATVRAVHSQRIYVEKAGIPSPLLNLIKRLAAFQNPEFYKKQSMRLSTALTPRVIACAQDLEQHVALPRGCLVALQALLHQYGTSLSVDDQRVDGDPIDAEFQGELTPVQKQAARALLAHDIGVFVAPPGIGKTVLGTHMIARRQRSTLILVHRRPLFDQWVAQLSMFLGIKEQEIGQIGGGKSKPNGRIDVAMIQSLVRRDSVDDLVARYGHVIVDECHHVPAVSFERVLSEIKARYVLGLTATPQRRDGHQPILEMQLGPVRFSVDAKNPAIVRPFERRLVARKTGFRLSEAQADASIQEIYRAVSTNDARNRLIIEDVLGVLQEGRSAILLTERRDHLEHLSARLRDSVRHMIVLQGGMGAKERKAVADQLDSIPGGEASLVMATGRYIGEGFDSARLDTLFLAMPISWKGTLVQYTGRLHRLHPSKTEVRIYDYVDSEVGMLSRMFEKRMRAYRAIGYALDDTSAREVSAPDRCMAPIGESE
ncbi:MAG TPA: DEAD/DEAH box helicase family protein [Planctomycetota bacterium]|nr:DEAD/DEAH box helicase family protein [Planctomycetota bacterium]